MIRIGVIGVQGAVSEHIEILNGVLGERGTAFWMRAPEKVHGIVIPGGESTTITKLMQETGLWEFVKTEAAKGTPILGTCAGLVVLSKEGKGDSKKTGQPFLGLLDCVINRNAFGGQRESFETPVQLSFLDSDFPGVFIRAPAAVETNGNTKIVSQLASGEIVGIESGNVLGLSFHPELSGDARVHEYFVGKISKQTF